MAKISKTVVDTALRSSIFTDLFFTNTEDYAHEYQKINDRQYGIILTDLNGEQRYVRIGAIVAELREDMTAQELMQSEIDTYTAKQAEKAEKERKKAEKIEKDKARREAETKKKEEKNNDVA